MGKATNSGKRSSRRIVATERQTKALQYRLQGHSFADIAAHMSITKTRVQQLVQAAMREREASFFETLEAVRTLELARLDRMMQDHFPKQATDLDAAAIVLRIMERRAAYLGLDAPHEAKVAYLPPHDAPDVDLSLLTIDELKIFRDLMAKASRRTPNIPAIEHQPCGIQIMLPPP